MPALITQRFVSRPWWVFAIVFSACHRDPVAVDASPITNEVNDASYAHEANDTSDASDASARDASAPEGMLFVPGGTFTMGSNRGGEGDEHPAHAVTLDGFWLDQTPVTNEAYAKCFKAGRCRHNDPKIASELPAFSAPHHPVVGVAWDDAKAYCVSLNRRLPREAEYERAMRGDDGRTYAWGNSPPTPELTTFGRQLDWGTTDDVGTHPKGRGPYGHDDLAGNVWEWCDDEYDPRAYTRPTADRGIPASCDEIKKTQDDLRAHDLQGFTGSNPIPFTCEHVLRGGAFNYDAEGLRATNRVHHPGNYKLLMAGFRCAKDLDGQK